MDNKLHDQFLIIQDTIYSNRQDYYNKMKKRDSKIDNLTAIVKKMMDNIQIDNSSPYNMDSPNS